MGVAAPLGGVAARDELVDDARQDGALAREPGAVRRFDRVRAGRRMGERIELEGTDQARVEALEVEDRDAGVEARHRLEERAALHLYLRRVRRPSDARRDAAAPAQLRQVEPVEARDARPDAVERHARDEAALDGEAQEALALEDVDHEAGVLEVVGRERLGVLAPEARDLGRGVGRVLVDLLAAPEHRAGDGLEPVVDEAERVANERDAVEDDAARDLGARLAREAEILDEAGAAGHAAERRIEAQRLAAPDQDAEVEVDDVPPDQHVGIQGGEALE